MSERENIGKHRFDKIRKVFEDERSQPRSNGQVHRDNNNCNIKDVNKSKNNTNKEEFGGKDPEDEEEKSEEEQRRVKFAASLQQSIDKSGCQEGEEEEEEEDNDSAKFPIWSNSVSEDSESIDDWQTKRNSEGESIVPSLGETERMILDEMTTATLLGDSTATKKNTVSKGGDSAKKANGGGVLDEFLRDEISMYADSELGETREAKSKKALEGDTADRIRVRQDTAEDAPGFSYFSSEYIDSIGKAVASRPSQAEIISTERETLASSPAIYEKKKSSAVFDDLDVEAPSPVPETYERTEVTPSPALTVKAAARAWPFESGTSAAKVEGQRGAITAPVKGGYYSPRVSFTKNEDLSIPSTSDDDDSEKKGDYDGGSRRSERLEGEIRDNKAYVKKLTNWLMTGNKYGSNFSRPVVRYEDYFPNDGDSEYPYAIPTGRLSPRGKSLRRRFEQVRLMSSAPAMRVPLATEYSTDSQLSGYFADKKQEHAERLSFRESGEHYRKSSHTTDHGTKARVKTSEQLGRQKPDKTHQWDLFADDTNIFASETRAKEEDGTHRNRDIFDKYEHPVIDRKSERKPRPGLSPGPGAKGQGEKHSQLRRRQVVGRLLQLKPSEQADIMSNSQRLSEERRVNTNHNRVKEMVRAHNANNNFEVYGANHSHSVKKMDAAENHGSLNANGGNGVELSKSEGLRKETKKWGDGMDRKKAELSQRLKDAKEIKYTSSFLSRGPLDHWTVGQAQFDQYLRDWNDRLQQRFNKMDDNCKGFIFPLGYAMQCQKKKLPTRRRANRAPNMQVSHRRVVTLQLSDPCLVNEVKPNDPSLPGLLDNNPGSVTDNRAIQAQSAHYPSINRMQMEDNFQNQKKPSSANWKEIELRNSEEGASSAMFVGHEHSDDLQKRASRAQVTNITATPEMRNFSTNLSNVASNNRGSLATNQRPIQPTNQRPIQPTNQRRHAIDLSSPLRGVERLDAKLRRLLPDKQKLTKAAGAAKRKRDGKENFFGVPVVREVAKRDISDCGGGVSGGCDEGEGVRGRDVGKELREDSNVRNGVRGGSLDGRRGGSSDGRRGGSSDGRRGGESENKIVNVEKKISPIKRLKGKLSATVGKWRKKRGKNTETETDEKIGERGKSDGETDRRAEEEKHNKCKKRNRTMGEVKKELRRNIAEMEKTVTSLTRLNGKDRASMVDGTDPKQTNERKNTSENHHTATMATVIQRYQSTENIKDLGKSVTFYPRCPDIWRENTAGIAGLTTESSGHTGQTSKSVRQAGLTTQSSGLAGLSSKSTEPNNRPTVETVRFVIERTLPLTEMDRIVESSLPTIGKRRENNISPRLETSKEATTEKVTERWFCPPTKSIPRSWISNFLADPTERESYLGTKTNAEMTIQEKLEREVIAGLAGWGESGETCGGSGDGGKKSDPPVQITPGENKPASPTNVMTKAGPSLSLSNSNRESKVPSRPASSLSGSLARELHIRRAEKILSRQASSNNVRTNYAIAASRSPTPSPVLRATDFPPRLVLPSNIGNRGGAKSTSALNPKVANRGILKERDGCATSLIGFPSVPTPVKRTSSFNSFHIPVDGQPSRGSTLRISQTQGPTESLESVNLNMEELTRQLRAQNRQVVGIHVSDELIIRTEEESPPRSFFKSISKFLFGGGGDDGLWQDVVSVFWSQRPQTASDDRKTPTDDYNDNCCLDPTPTPRFRDLIWPGSIAGRPTTQISGLIQDEEKSQGLSTKKTKSLNSLPPNESRRPNTAPTKPARERICNVDNLRASKSVVIGDDNRCITFFDLPEEGVEYHGSDSDRSLIEAPSSEKLGHVGGSATLPRERTKSHVKMKREVTSEPPIANGLFAGENLNAFNANGFRLIQKPETEVSANAMTEEEINECRRKASEFERKLRKNMDMRPCPKEEFLEICELVKVARDNDRAILEKRKNQSQKKKNEGKSSKETKKVKEIIKEASLISICESQSSQD